TYAFQHQRYWLAPSVPGTRPTDLTGLFGVDWIPAAGAARGSVAADDTVLPWVLDEADATEDAAVRARTAVARVLAAVQDWLADEH
ncbi:hypothetical protein ACPXCX_56955, partial [Streptomyces sp. DT225]